MALIHCPECQKTVSSLSPKCPYCGYPLAQKTADKPSTGLNVLSFCIPLAGLILYCVKQGDYPRQARSIGKWAIAGVVLGIVGWAILLFFEMNSSIYF